VKRQLNAQEQQVINHARTLGLKVTVPPTLRPGSRILVCGEAAGMEEELEEEGFVGAAGKLLTKMLNAAGIPRDSVSFTNVVKKHPHLPFNEEFYESVKVEVGRGVKAARIDPQRVKKASEKWGVDETTALDWLTRGKPKFKREIKPTYELDLWHGVLDQEVTLAKPEIVIAVGENALRALTTKVGISHWQGSRLRGHPHLDHEFDLVPILHPSGILRGQSWQDVYLTTRILERVRKDSWPVFPAPHVWSEPPDIADVLLFLWKCWTADRWCIDVETRGGHVVCFAVAANWGERWESMCIPMARTDAIHAKWPWAENHRVWTALSDLYEHNSRVVNHYLCAFESTWFDFYGVHITDHYMDTLIAFHLLYPELPKALDYCIQFYGLGNYHKGMVKHTAKSLKNETLWEYNNLDSIRTLQLSYAIDADLDVHGLRERYSTDRKAAS